MDMGLEILRPHDQGNPGLVLEFPQVLAAGVERQLAWAHLWTFCWHLSAAPDICDCWHVSYSFSVCSEARGLFLLSRAFHGCCEYRRASYLLPHLLFTLDQLGPHTLSSVHVLTWNPCPKGMLARLPSVTLPYQSCALGLPCPVGCAPSPKVIRIRSSLPQVPWAQGMQLFREHLPHSVSIAPPFNL